MNVGLKLATLNNIPLNRSTQWMNTPSEWSPSVPFQMHWIAIQEASRREKKEFSESFDEFMDMLEEDPNLLQQIAAIQEESQPVNDEKKTPEKLLRKVR